MAEVKVVLRDETDGEVIGEAVVASVQPGELATASFTWYTSGCSTGDHRISGRHTLPDDDATNDGASATVSLVAPAGPMTMHVGDIGGWATSRGNSGKWVAYASVTVLDQDDVPVCGAEVQAVWSGGYVASVSGLTGSDGSVLFKASKPGGVSVVFTVVDVRHVSGVYDPSLNWDGDGDGDDCRDYGADGPPFP